MIDREYLLKVLGLVGPSYRENPKLIYDALDHNMCGYTFRHKSWPEDSWVTINKDGSVTVNSIMAAPQLVELYSKYWMETLSSEDWVVGEKVDD